MIARLRNLRIRIADILARPNRNWTPPVYEPVEDFTIAERWFVRAPVLWLAFALISYFTHSRWEHAPAFFGGAILTACMLDVVRWWTR